jgi:hypothetical protein
MHLLYLILVAKVISTRIPVRTDNKIMFGSWLDTSDTQGKDRPILFNNRMDFNATCFQYAQNLPNNDFDLPDTQVPENTCIMLTIYPKPNPWNITDADIKKLSNELVRLSQDQHFSLFLRIAPEMNGNWNEYGQQPIKYVILWKRIVDIIRENTKDISFVWAPSVGASYPFNPAKVVGNDTELMGLDSNKDGTFDNQDDPYSVYFPGNDYVDWVGLSIYHYGLHYPWIDNVISQLGDFESQLNDHGFYNTYKNKPVMVSEGASCYHVDSPNGIGIGELAVKQSFWRQWLTNNTLFDTFPQLKMVNLFEFLKREELTLRDFRISINDTIRSAFLQDFASVRYRYVSDANLTMSLSIFFVILISLIGMF